MKNLVKISFLIMIFSFVALTNVQGEVHDHKNCNGHHEEKVVKKEIKVSKNDQIIKELEKSVPEIKVFVKKTIKAGYKPVIVIDEEPDPDSEEEIIRDHYIVYVGTNMKTHRSVWYRFAVPVDNKKPELVFDVVSGDYVSLKDWRKELKEFGFYDKTE